jgi:hypothetical protein
MSSFISSNYFSTLPMNFFFIFIFFSAYFYSLLSSVFFGVTNVFDIDKTFFEEIIVELRILIFSLEELD